MPEEDGAMCRVSKAKHEALRDEMRYGMDAYEDGMCAACGRPLNECLAACFREHVQSADVRPALARP